MAVNLSHYNMCFKNFDLNYDPLNNDIKENIIDKSKNTCESTKKFVKILEKHSAEITCLGSIAARISALNKYFCTLLATQYKINIDKELDINFLDSTQFTALKSSAQFGHHVAKLTLEDLPSWVDSIYETIKEIEDDIERKSQVHLNEKVMDEVSNQLLAGSHVDTPLLSMKFGGVKYEASAERGGHTHRSMTSLLQDKEFGVSQKVDPELFQIKKSLQRFADTAKYNGFKLGLSK